MKNQWLLIALTVVNLALLLFSLTRSAAMQSHGDSTMLRGRGLEIVDEQGKVRASITVFPEDPKVQMPDGTTGYPETVLLRLIDPNGRPNVKIQATELGGGVGFGGADDPTYAMLSAKGTSSSLKLTNQDGIEQIISP
jgi:hypothetical protein